MLGLANAMSSGGAVYKLVDTYTSDFTGGGGDNSSDWGDFSVEGGSITYTTNTDSIGGENDWLKCAFPANQTVTSGITSDCNNFTMSKSDYQTFSFKIYLDGDWEGSDAVSIGLGFQSTSNGVIVDASLRTSAVLNTASVAQDTVVTVFGICNSQNTNNTNMRIYASSILDEPQAGALMYIKDVEIKTYRLFG